jgi:hypothetical protein
MLRAATDKLISLQATLRPVQTQHGKTQGGVHSKPCESNGRFDCHKELLPYCAKNGTQKWLIDLIIPLVLFFLAWVNNASVHDVVSGVAHGIVKEIAKIKPERM